MTTRQLVILGMLISSPSHYYQTNIYRRDYFCHFDRLAKLITGYFLWFLLKKRFVFMLSILIMSSRHIVCSPMANLLWILSSLLIFYALLSDTFKHIKDNCFSGIILTQHFMNCPFVILTCAMESFSVRSLIPNFDTIYFTFQTLFQYLKCI